MRKNLTPIAMGICLLSVVSAPAFAQHKVHHSNDTQSLERQIAELRQEVNAMKGPQPLAYNSNMQGNPRTAQHQPTGASASGLYDPNAPSVSGPQYLPKMGTQYLPVDVSVPGQAFVSTGPYIGVPLQYNGGDLVVNSPSINEDVLLLNLRKNITKRLCEMGLKDAAQSDHTHLLLSGVVEAEAITKRVGHQRSSSDIDITNAGLDAYILGTQWTTGLISVRYDNSIGAVDGTFANNSRSQNSRIFLDKAFIILGNFCRSPIYATFGQMYVPFGVYSTSMISSPLTKLLFRTQARAILLGYQQQADNAFYAAGYVFKGDAHVTNNNINNGGINLGYKYDLHCGKYEISGNFGGGVIANIADSQGIQNNGYGAVYVPPTVLGQSAVFGGFGGMVGTGDETLAHRVPGANLRGLFSFGKDIDILAEYITASRSFSAADLTYQSHGAKPQALNAEFAYTFQGLVHPVSLSAGYGMTKDALALGLPLNRYAVTANTSFWRNTIESLEFRHENNYAASAVSSGSGIPGPKSSGKSDNVVTAQIDLFF